MENVPVTSMTLLKALGQDIQSPRWTEFAKKYDSLMDGFLLRYFPTVDGGVAKNETLIALTQKLPLYEYDPDEKGHFRNYLIGIVRYKAIEQLKRQKRDAELKKKLNESKFEWVYQARTYSVDLSDWQREAYEAALQQFMADPAVSARDKEIFRRLCRRGESPAEVAAIYDITRNNVDQIKARTVARLKKLAEQYASVCNEGKNGGSV